MSHLRRLSLALAGALLFAASMASVTGAPRAQGGDSAEEVFEDHISEPVVQSRCIKCHVAGGVSSHTRLVLAPSTAANHETLNLETFRSLLDAVADDGGARYVLNKIQGVAHGGGAQVPAGSSDFANMEWFLQLLAGGDTATASLTPATLFDTVRLAPHWKTLRRAALIFAGRLPTDEEYAAVEGGDESDLRTTIRGLMAGPEFHEFLIRGSNDRLLTDRDTGAIIDDNEPHFVDYTNESYRRKKAADASGDWGKFWNWRNAAQFGFRRAPLELIAYVVENDLPYTEILTADYIMANPWAAKGYGASTRFDDPEDPREFRRSRIVTYYRKGDDMQREYDDDLVALYVPDPGSLSTVYPHAGILNTNAFLNRYPTTATNRNRARARWTYYHFLGLDIEKSASRTTDPVALADTNNPTMHNPNCTVCHTVMDPVAGAFQNYSDDGYYKHASDGVDSLDRLYKVGVARAVEAESWEERQTLAWRLPLTAGVETLRVLFTNHFWDEAAEEGGQLYLDRLDVVDGDGNVVDSKEFEDLAAPVAHWGACGEARSTRGGARDHLLLWGGWLDCAMFIDVRVPVGGVHDAEVVAWSDGPDERYFSDSGFADMSVTAKGYQEGDTWYRDMRLPGFDGAAAPDADNSVQWLARKIVADERFAEATVRFWWPAIMGSDVAEFPEESSDADFEGRLLSAGAQDAEVMRLAEGFRKGFAGSSYTYNLKDLLLEIVLSEWFRADAVTDADPVRRTALRDAGARRLLTPEELARKTLAITGMLWGREINNAELSYASSLRTDLTDAYRLLYGGIDSDGITERARDLTSVMAGVAKRHAVQVGCPVVLRDLYLVSDTERRLFGGIAATETGAAAIKAKLVELHEMLLGVRVAADSADVEAAYQLFVDVSQRRGGAGNNRFEWWRCSFSHDHYYFQGILDDVLERHENEDGWWWHQMDWDRVEPFMNSRNLADPNRAARAWVAVLTAMLMDYRYLYL